MASVLQLDQMTSLTLSQQGGMAYIKHFVVSVVVWDKNSAITQSMFTGQMFDEFDLTVCSMSYKVAPKVFGHHLGHLTPFGTLSPT